MPSVRKLSSRSLRAEIAYRNLEHTAGAPHEVTFSRVPSVVYGGDGATHGNFLPASYRRILANPAWASRLEKSYTGRAQMPRAGDRRRRELECAVSSDALLMNIFCYPGVLRRRDLCACLGIDPGLRPRFGVRAQLPMRGGEIDRTEFDMAVGDLWVEAKLTESGFGRAGRERVLRYCGVETAFDVDALPAGPARMTGYQIVRGLLAAMHEQRRYLVLLDRRRADLVESCFRVLRAMRDADASSRFRLVTWQEVARTLPPILQGFLADRYGIEPG